MNLDTILTTATTALTAFGAGYPVPEDRIRMLTMTPLEGSASGSKIKLGTMSEPQPT